MTRVAEHIVVIEDEEHLAFGIQENLEAEGYRVKIFGDGPQALEYLAIHDDVDLVVLDLMLPGMSGYSVCEQLRTDGLDMPVLIVSARTLSEDRVRGFEVGADQYMMKPFELDEFLSRVKNMLARYNRRKATAISENSIPQFTLGDATIDLAAFEVRIADKVITLTQLEAKLLEYFIRHEGRVIPRSELLQQVWDMPGHLNTRAPDQFIRRLRKLLEPDPATPQYFVTIRDAGYRFTADPR